MIYICKFWLHNHYSRIVEALGSANFFLLAESGLLSTTQHAVVFSFPFFSSDVQTLMGRFQMTVRLFFILVLTIAVASQPLETIATSDGASPLTQFLNWAQIGFEAILVWARQGLGIKTEEVTTTTSAASEYCSGLLASSTIIPQKKFRKNFR